MKKQQLNPNINITMTSYEWHLLLNDIEDHLRIVNRDRRTTASLYEKIASQLLGAKVTYLLDEPKKKESPNTVENKSDEIIKQCWLHRIFKGFGR